MSKHVEVAGKQIASSVVERLLESYRYAMGSGVAMVINLGVTAFGHEILELSEELAYAIALFIAFFVSFFLMRNYVRRAGHGAIGRQMVGFLVSAIGFRIAEYLLYVLLVGHLRVQYLLSIIFVNGLSFVVKFFYYRAFVFADRRPQVD